MSGLEIQIDRPAATVRPLPVAPRRSAVHPLKKPIWRALSWSMLNKRVQRGRKNERKKRKRE